MTSSKSSTAYLGPKSYPYNRILTNESLDAPPQSFGDHCPCST